MGSTKELPPWALELGLTLALMADVVWWTFTGGGLQANWLALLLTGTLLVGVLLLARRTRAARES